MSATPTTVAVLKSAQTHWDHSYVAAEQVLVCRVMVQLVHVSIFTHYPCINPCTRDGMFISSVQLSTSVRRILITVLISASMTVAPSHVHADQDIC